MFLVTTQQQGDLLHAGVLHLRLGTEVALRPELQPKGNRTDKITCLHELKHLYIYKAQNLSVALELEKPLGGLI